jgi:hypothetical protein
MLKTFAKIIPIILLLLIGTYFAYIKIFQLEPSAKITQLKGEVEKKTKDGQWIPVRIGSRLTIDEGVKTGREAEVTMTLADQSTVKIEKESELSVKEMTEAVAKFKLKMGKVTADVKESKERQFKIETEGSDAVVTTKHGIFVMTSTGKGTVVVATKTGDVELKAKEKAVKVSAGSQSKVLPGEAPKEAEPIPKSVFLKVDWPPARKLNVKETTIKGTTDVGAMVSINGVRVAVDPTGRFEANVALEEGRNKIQVVTEDAVRNIKEENSPELIVDTEGADLKIRDEDLWK